MKKFISKQLHSGFSSFSSNDRYVYEDVSDIKDNIIEETYNIIEISQDEQIKIFYEEEDKTYYNISNIKHEATKKQMDDLVDNYLKIGYHSVRPFEIYEYYNRKEQKEREQRKEEGYIYWFKYEDYSPEKIQGGLSDSVFNSKDIQEYIKFYPHGYIGHSIRKPELDRFIEKEFLTIIPKNAEISSQEVFISWLTSRTGRHFGNSLERLTFKEQKELILKEVKQMYNNAYIFLKPEHNGTLSSSKELLEKYKEELI